MFGGPYATYVLVAYISTLAIIGALVWSTVAASRRARRELEGLDRRGGTRT